MSPAIRICAVTLCFLLASLGASAQALTPSGDAYVRGGSAANNNYGGVVLLGVRTANTDLNTYWSYIKFDTSGVEVAPLVWTVPRGFLGAIPAG